MPTPSRRRWFRFSLRTMLILIAVVALPAAWVAKERRQSAFDRQVAAKLVWRGFDVEFTSLYFSTAPSSKAKSQVRWNELSDLVFGQRILKVRGAWRDTDDLTVLEGLQNIQGLYLANYPVEDLTPLAQLVTLRTLVLRGTKVSNLAPLAGLNQLQVLDLGATEVEDLKPLSGLTQLKHLSLNEARQIMNISPLADLTSLKVLNLGHTFAKDLSPLKNLIDLEELSVTTTRVNDVAALGGLKNLHTLDLCDTYVSDPTPLMQLSSLTTLQLYRSSVPRHRADELRNALPKCNVIGP